MGGKPLLPGKKVHILINLPQGILCIVRKCGFVDKIIHRQRAGEPGRPAGRQGMVRPGQIISQRLRTILAQKDRSGIFDPMDYPAVAIDKQQQIRTEFVAVRFGNVLGSNGSVVPLFKKQIAAGGPVTVTHPDIIRYFMTIPEAVSLVLQAGTYAKGGEIFVLDMGQPVKIDTLARNLIKLSGYTPDVDIKIVYTGLRPGEKLCEETLMAEEGMTKTDNQLIFIGKPIELDVDEFFGQLTELAAFSYRNDEDIVAKVSELVPTFITPEKFNAKYVKENAPRETVKV